MNNITIRKVTLVDLPELQKIGIQTFRETFSAENSDEDMQKYLDEKFNDIQVSKELNNPDSEFYFAILEGEIVGYLKMNFKDAQTELRHNDYAEIERIYVLEDFIGKKVGQLLFDKALEVADSYKVNFVWLGVWEENYRAIRFYEKNGFETFDKHIFRLGNDEQTDLMMRKQITH
ncbi:GNAT family N-acetyltransferase [Solitalea canadensis]|uniref:Acetyltransferase n=1 Tax=Solitalea canadensis (strain ATCC 29591 / DSM 3403 / JCM 21819 / LMG 8368 / NBRC 15130 / NCIMB 12057 / USAM 9D) TaxID=929556 RepID=H8KNE8_SOLCM|nr:GNAT family N-acetyltransferase [Solitalea canadensis]AFD07946.1 acetyltransferase [Solitalea canadensis DSM 3403]